MAFPGNRFEHFPGNIGDPQFIEWVYKGHVVESVGTQQLINILHFLKVNSTGTPTNLANVFALIDGLLSPAVGAAISDLYVADETTLRAMDNAFHPPIVFGNNIVGAPTGARLPSFNSAVVRKDTYGRGRRFRGSNHWAPVASSTVTLDQLTGAGLVAFQGLATALAALTNITDMDGNTWSLFVLSSSNSITNSNPTDFSGSIVRTCSANLKIGTMKRRKEGVGT